VSSPAWAIAYRDAAFAARRTWGRFWIAFYPHREVSSTLGISAAVHGLLFLLIGSHLYDSGNDDHDVPELSVQLETREGPNDPEFTEAALPKPAPDPVEDVLDDPGTAQRNRDEVSFAASEVPVQEDRPDVTETQEAVAHAQQTPPEFGEVVTTIGTSDNTVAMVAETAPSAAAVIEMPQPEQVMLTRNVQQLAQKLLDTDMTDTELTWEQDGQQYQARVMRQTAPDSTGIEQVTAEILTDKAGKRMKTTLSLKRLAFSHFTQLVNDWDRDIQLHDDVIDGRFHSNTEINFTAGRDVRPRFFGKVTTAAATLTFNGFNRRRNQDVFQGGFETRTDRVTLPRDMPDVVNGGEESDRRVFTQDTRVIFNADGSYAWRPADGTGTLRREEPSQRARYLIGAKDVKLFVRGTVAGIFTIYTPDDIEIEDDLVYSKDPRQTVLSRDFLALISGRDVSVSPAEVTGRGDLTVHGAIFAKRRFYIEHPDRGDPGDTLVIYGSLTAGTLSETEPRYATQIDFDKRFEYLRPASFPMTRRYEVDSWNQDWEEVQSGGDSRAGLAQAQ
jgi:hypothetical protein